MNILVWTSVQTDPSTRYPKDKFLEVKLLDRHHQLSFQKDIPIWTCKHSEYKRAYFSTPSLTHCIINLMRQNSMSLFVATWLPFLVSNREASLHLFKTYVYFSVSPREKMCPLWSEDLCFWNVGMPDLHGSLPSQYWLFLRWNLYIYVLCICPCTHPFVITHSSPSAAPLASLPLWYV